MSNTEIYMQNEVKVKIKSPKPNTEKKAISTNK